MVEWHITPEYIVNNWTDELLSLMVAKLTERKQREMAKKPEGDHTVPIEILAAKSNSMIKVVDNRGH